MKKHTFIALIMISLSFISLATADTKKALIPKEDIIIEENGIIISANEINLMFNDMTRIQKIRMLSNKDNFQGLLYQALILKKKAAEAKKRNIHKKETTEWKLQNLKNQLLANEMKIDFEKNIDVPKGVEGIAKDIYDANPDYYKVGEQRKVSHILVLVNKDSPDEEKQLKLQKTEQILKEINNGLDFAVAAKQYSDDTASAKTGGVIDYFTKGKMVPPFEEAAFSLNKINELSKITESQFGFHIIKLLGKKEAYIKTFDEVKKELISQERNKYIARKSDEFMKTFNINKNTNFYVPAFDKFYNEKKASLDKLIRIK